MSGPLPVSLVIVSRHRPQMLRRCLTAVAQMDHPAFEVIVVADHTGLSATSGFPVRTAAFDAPNISAARNLGIVAAAGEVVAFIDDDAVPEPRWLSHLTAPFADPEVAAAGGFMVGANGFSFQWRSGTVDRLLHAGPLVVPEDQASLHRAVPGRAIEIKGANCAYRRAVLAGLGGFDPELRYFLDETELNLRLAETGAMTAVVPDARVHHDKAASHLRHADLTPKSLWDVGASTAVTLRRHGANPSELAAAWARLRSEEGEKLAARAAAHRIGPDEVERLAQTLSDGFEDGRARSLRPVDPLPGPQGPFRPFPAHARVVSVLSGRVWQGARLRAEAARRAGAGEVVRLFLFSPTTLFHRRRFVTEGYWLQEGGLFGRSDRRDPVFRFWRFARRVARESGIFASGFGKT
jgi:GT2 family glycosyltransferase